MANPSVNGTLTRSNSLLPFVQRLSSNPLKTGRHEAYKELITEVADALSEEDIERIIWNYELPRRPSTRLDMLDTLHRNGKLSEHNLDSLENLLEKTKRKDLVTKLLDPFRQKFLIQTEVISPQEPVISGYSTPIGLQSSLNSQELASSWPDNNQSMDQSDIMVTPANGRWRSPTVSPQGSPDLGSVGPIHSLPIRGQRKQPRKDNMYVSMPGEPTAIRRLPHSRSMETMLDKSHLVELGGMGQRSISIPRLSPIQQGGSTIGSSTSGFVTPLPVEDLQQPKHKKWVPFPWMRRHHASKQEEKTTFDWNIKIEQIHKYIFTRKLRDKRISCSKKLELCCQGHCGIKLSLHMHPYGIRLDANKNVSFVIEMDHTKRGKIHKVPEQTKVLLEMTITAKDEQLAQIRCEEDYRMSLFCIDQALSHETLKELDHTHKYLTLAVRARVYVPSL